MAVGESVVVHAGAGGVGSLAVQLAKAWGAGNVIATASTEAKRQTALDLGADVALDSSPEDLTERLKEANSGQGVDIVLEMAGGPVFDASLAALGRFGRMVTYGMASRVAPTSVAPGRLMTGSKSVVGFWLIDCIGRPGMLAEPLGELFDMTSSGALRPLLGGKYPLSDVRAHIRICVRVPQLASSYSTRPENAGSNRHESSACQVWSWVRCVSVKPPRKNFS